MDLFDKIVACHHGLAQAQIPHAFGGALALAWCTAQARGTIDIDINLFVGGDRIEEVLDALPPGVTWSEKDLVSLTRALQHRIWWEQTPLDLFFNSTDYHDRLIHNVRWETLDEYKIPFLSCEDLAVFKVFFDRTKDWADLEDMHGAGQLDVQYVAGVISHYLGPDDPRLKRLFGITAL